MTATIEPMPTRPSEQQLELRAQQLHAQRVLARQLFRAYTALPEVPEAAEDEDAYASYYAEERG